jgi:hypothetical protein
MYKKVALLTACVAATALLLAVSSAWAADPADEGEGGGSAASAAEIADICKAQAAKRSLTGDEADEYHNQSAAPIGDAERSATPGDRLEGQL